MALVVVHKSMTNWKQNPNPKVFTIDHVAEAFYAGWTAIGAGPCETKEAAFKHWLRIWRGCSRERPTIAPREKSPRMKLRRSLLQLMNEDHR